MTLRSLFVVFRSLDGARIEAAGFDTAVSVAVFHVEFPTADVAAFKQAVAAAIEGTGNAVDQGISGNAKPKPIVPKKPFFPAAWASAYVISKATEEIVGPLGP